MFALKAIMNGGDIAIIKDGFDRHNAAQKVMADDAIRMLKIQFGWVFFVGVVLPESELSINMLKRRGLWVGMR